MFPSIFEFIGYILLVAFAFYWGYAGNLVLTHEKKLWLKIVLIAGLLAMPVIMPAILYFFYYKPLSKWLRSLLHRRTITD